MNNDLIHAIWDQNLPKHGKSNKRELLIVKSLRTGAVLRPVMSQAPLRRASREKSGLVSRAHSISGAVPGHHTFSSSAHNPGDMLPSPFCK